jgi:hypothetical protein
MASQFILKGWPGRGIPQGFLLKLFESRQQGFYALQLDPNGSTGKSFTRLN